MSAEPVLLDPAGHEHNEEARTLNRAGVADVPDLLQDVWGCSECERTFPTPASTERHIEFEHGG
jgi:hypothetical protein